MALVNVAVELAANDLAPVPRSSCASATGGSGGDRLALHLGRICDAHKIASETLVSGLRVPADLQGTRTRPVG